MLRHSVPHFSVSSTGRKRITERISIKSKSISLLLFTKYSYLDLGIKVSILNTSIKQNYGYKLVERRERSHERTKRLQTVLLPQLVLKIFSL